MTPEYANSLFDYNPETGVLRWRVARGKIKPGAVVASRGAGGCLTVMVDGRNYKAHRIIWLLVKGVFPDPEIDHRDRNQGNNRWNNIREATSSQNKMNRPSRGIYLDKRDGRWYARVTVHGKIIHCGRHRTKEAAAAARASAARMHYGEFACQIP